jgi:small redox-active disulfide protein 2
MVTRGHGEMTNDERRMTDYAIRNTIPTQGANSMTLHIKVLGGGCANCANLEKNATAAIAGLDVDARIEHVSDPAEYARYGVLYTPGLVINDKLASAGRVPSVAEIATLLTNVLAAA